MCQIIYGLTSIGSLLKFCICTEWNSIRIYLNGKMVFILFQLQKGATNLTKYIDLID